MWLRGFFLKAYLIDLDGFVLYCTIRIYVDDITLTAVGNTANAVVRKFSRDLPKVKKALKDKEQDSNAKKSSSTRQMGKCSNYGKPAIPDMEAL